MLPPGALSDLVINLSGEVLLCDDARRLCEPVNSTLPLLIGGESVGPAISLVTNLTFTKGAWNTYSYPQVGITWCASVQGSSWN